MESTSGHPCQALADLMTIRERMNPKKKNFLLSWAPHIKALPMAVRFLKLLASTVEVMMPRSDCDRLRTVASPISAPPVLVVASKRVWVEITAFSTL